MSPELVEARTGVTRWAQPFDAAFTDVFAVQADIAGQVAGALHLALTDSTRARLGAEPHPEPRGVRALAPEPRAPGRRASPEALRAAIAELRQAVALDSSFVAAWADLARVQVEAFRQGGMVYRRGGRRATLARAVALAPASPDVRAASGRYKLVVAGTSPGRSGIPAALRMAPKPERPARAAGHRELELGRWPQAVADLEHAARLDPRSPDAASWLGTTYLRLRRYPEARPGDRARPGLRPTSLSLAYMRAGSAGRGRPRDPRACSARWRRRPARAASPLTWRSGRT